VSSAPTCSSASPISKGGVLRKRKASLPTGETWAWGDTCLITQPLRRNGKLRLRGLQPGTRALPGPLDLPGRVCDVKRLSEYRKQEGLALDLERTSRRSAWSGFFPSPHRSPAGGGSRGDTLVWGLHRNVGTLVGYLG
jgi:hypothetical protein